MAITPLYTKEYLDGRIERLKLKIEAAEGMAEYTAHDRTIKRQAINSLEQSLYRLHRHRMELESPGSGRGLQGVTMRVPRHG